MFDVFFVRTTLDRRAVVATKSACQLITHVAKLVYFGVLVGGASAISGDLVVIFAAILMAIAGTSLARPLLERMSNAAFRAYTSRILMVVGAFFLFRGVWGFL